MHTLVAIMNMDPECVPCLLGRVLYQADLCNPETSSAAMKSALDVLSNEFSTQKNSAEIATKVHRAAYNEMGVVDPYAQLKIQSCDVALSIFDKAANFIHSSEDPLEAAVRVAIAGNIMDFGVQGITDPETLSKNFDSLVSQPLAVNDLHFAKEKIRPGSKILYFLDNCGEDVLDILLIDELKSLGASVTGVVKGEPILTDVTMEDAYRSGVTNHFNNVISTGMFAIGVSVGRISDALTNEIKTSDLIISKGMANFEAMSDSGIRPILYLFRAKCSPVARAAGVSKNDNVAKLIN